MGDPSNKRSQSKTFRNGIASLNDYYASLVIKIAQELSFQLRLIHRSETTLADRLLVLFLFPFRFPFQFTSQIPAFLFYQRAQ
jgi:hypothetical protein